jgi:hypothetical protein
VRARVIQVDDDIIAGVSESTNAIIRYRFRRYVLGDDPEGAEMRRLRTSIRDSAVARGLLQDLTTADPSDRNGMSTIYLTFRYLADIDYPPGDRSLIPYRDQVYGWLHSLEAQYDGPLLIRGKYRVHGSFHANAIYASVVLGIANRETDQLAANLLRYQWPGGGWNCNKLPRTRGPTIVHTAYGLRGLVSYRSRKVTAALSQAIEEAAEVLLARQVFLKRSNGRPLRPVFTKLSYPYPRLYDFMAGLHILTRSGHVRDPRCGRALDLLESKLVARQGWPAERRLFSHTRGSKDFTHAEWDKETLGKASLFLTVDALEILKAAGRWA